MERFEQRFNDEFWEDHDLDETNYYLIQDEKVAEEEQKQYEHEADLHEGSNAELTVELARTLRRARVDLKSSRRARMAEMNWNNNSFKSRNQKTPEDRQRDKEMAIMRGIYATRAHAARLAISDFNKGRDGVQTFMDQYNGRRTADDDKMIDEFRERQKNGSQRKDSEVLAWKIYNMGQSDIGRFDRKLRHMEKGEEVPLWALDPRFSTKEIANYLVAKRARDEKFAKNPDFSREENPGERNPNNPF